MEDRKSTKLCIPHNAEEHCSIVGILEQLAPGQPTRGRKIAVILHGMMGHKDYLFLKRLAVRLPVDSFRFDFRGHHESSGTWRLGGPQDEIADLSVVIDHLKRNYGYEIDLLVAHSRGALVALHWLCTSNEAKTVGGFVNVSGRYRMRKIYDGPVGKMWKSAIESQGYYEWKVVVARKQVVVKIYPQDLEEVANWDSSMVWDQFPNTTDVLTIHGFADNTVPPYDALIYARAFGGRSPGTHNLHMIEEADHHFTGHQEEVVDTILHWWNARQTGGLTTGVWMTGVKGRL